MFLRFYELILCVCVASSFTFTSSSTFAGPLPCPPDLTNDGVVNASDLAVMLGAWGQNVGHPADITKDGVVNASDLAVLLGSWGLCGDCSRAEQCDDDLFCNGQELCLMGQCEAGTPPSCGDSDPCTADTCTELEGCVHTPGAPCNNDCADRTDIFDGDTAYDTIGATTDGSGNANCAHNGQIYLDIWYNYTATCQGLVTVSTCGQADYDTELAVYDGCDCADLHLLDCNDDNEDCAGLTSEVVVPVVIDDCYKVRVGGADESNAGSGTISISCDPGCATQQDCDDGNACTQDSCDPGLGCLHVISNGPCNDGVFCNGSDTCSDGTCSLHSGNPCVGGPECADSCNESDDNCNDPAGIQCGDIAETDCDHPDTCDGNGNCAANVLPNGTLCSDANDCTSPDTCQQGVCISGPPGCNDGDVCTIDSCDALSGCVHTPNNVACDDGLFCNGADTCSGGTCSSHSGSPCTGPDGDFNCAESCNEALENCTAADPNGADCDDFSFCNGPDKCLAGVCSSHSGNPCPGPDGDADCSESCDEAADDCTAPDPNGSSCVDGLFCNGSDTCSGGGCNIHSSSPCPGSDGDGNCSESCNEAMDACIAPDPNGSPCNDGVFCNGADTCVAGGCTAHAGFPCGAGQTCHEGTDQCTCTTVAHCNDGNACTTDACNAGFCAHTNLPAGTACGSSADTNCDNPDTCSSIGICQSNHETNGATCFDENFCNGTDSCQNGVCIPIGVPADCNDFDPCTSDSCDPLSRCVHTPIVPCP